MLLRSVVSKATSAASSAASKASSAVSSAAKTVQQRREERRRAEEAKPILAAATVSSASYAAVAAPAPAAAVDKGASEDVGRAEQAEEDMVEAMVLLDVPGVMVYRVNNGSGNADNNVIVESAELAFVEFSDGDNNDDNNSSSEQKRQYLLVVEDLQIGLARQTPCFKISDGVYVFVDPVVRGAHLVVVMTDAEDALVEKMEQLLQRHTDLRERVPESWDGDDARRIEKDDVSYASAAADAVAAPATVALPVQDLQRQERAVVASVMVEENSMQKSDKVASSGHKLARGIERGSVMLASGIAAGGVLVGKQIQKTGSYLYKRIRPAAAPKHVSERTKRRLAYAQQASMLSVKLARGLAKASVAAAEQLAEELSGAVVQTKAYADFQARSSNPRAEAAKHVAASTLDGMVKVYKAMEEAGVLVLAKSCDTTVDLLGHKYGDEMKQASAMGLGAVKNFGTAAISMNRVGLTAVAKRATVAATVDVLSTEEEKEQRRLEAAQSAQLSPEEAVVMSMAKVAVKQQANVAVAVANQQLQSSKQYH